MLPLNLDPAEVYIDSLPAEGSKRAMRTSLRTIAKILTGEPDTTLIKWGELTYAHTVAVRSYLSKNYKPKTINRMLASWRAALKSAWRLGLIDSENYGRIADVRSENIKERGAGRYLDKDEVEQLLMACERGDRNSDRRDLAILHIFLYAGLRRNELAMLDVGDFDMAERVINIRFGKGRKQRIAFIPTKTAQVIQEWLEVYQPEGGDSPLVVNIDRGDGVHKNRISTEAIYMIVQKRAAQAGIESVSPHDFRRTYISNMFDRGVDISTIAQLVGHDSTAQTSVYDRRKDSPKRRAADLLDD